MAGAGEVVGKVVFWLCGPKGSLCCFALSLWGVIMLFLLGTFYYVESVVLLGDLIKKVEKTNTTGLFANEFSDVTYYDPQKITEAYHNAAISCWGAGVVYVFFLILSGTFIAINLWREKVKAH